MHRSLAVRLTLVLLVASCGTEPSSERAEFLGSYQWTTQYRWFGGLSAISVSGGGTAFVALSDKSVLLEGKIHRKDGKISSVTLQNPRNLLASSGRLLSAQTQDSEGLAISSDGTAYVSFEGVHRVARYDDWNLPAIPLKRPRWFRSLPLNGSLEALAIDPQNRLYTLPEDTLFKTAGGDRAIPVFRWDGHEWSIFTYLEKKGKFLPVGADFGPDGRFYLLERAVGILGFRSRVRRWDLSDTGLENEATLFSTGPGTHDNLEGISVWRDSDKRIRATMVSDDNFMVFQRTELVEYIFKE